MRKLMRSAGLLLALGLTALPAMAETTLEKIRREGKITVGTEAAFPPFEFVQDGKIVGYGKDILDVVVAELGVELVQLDLPFQGILPGLLAGQFDFVATSLGINPERTSRYAFTAPVVDAGPAVLVRKGDSVTSLDDLAGRSLASQLASSYEPVIRQLEKEAADGGKALKEVKLYTSFPDAYMALATGETDAVLQNGTSLAVLMKERPGLFEIGFEPQIEGTYGHLSWAARAEDGDLRDFVSDVIWKMQDDGRLQQLQEKWFGRTFVIPKEGYLPPGAK